MVMLWFGFVLCFNFFAVWKFIIIVITYTWMFSQVARIEEQQKAINSLKANLMDDLNARGILSTPECEKVLSVHKEVSVTKLAQTDAKWTILCSGYLLRALKSTHLHVFLFSEFNKSGRLYI